MNISFNQPTSVGKELEYMQQALQDGHISGDGQFTKKAHALLEETIGVPKVLLDDILHPRAGNVGIVIGSKGWG